MNCNNCPNDKVFSKQLCKSCYNKKWRQNHKQYVKDYNANYKSEYYENNKIKLQKYSNIYYYDNRSIVLQKQKEYYKNNSKIIKIRNKSWRVNNPLQVKFNNKMNRIKRNSTRDRKLDIISLHVKKRDGFKCRWGGCNNTKLLQANHILPKSKFPELKYEKRNIITYCPYHHYLYHELRNEKNAANFIIKRYYYDLNQYLCGNVSYLY